MAAMMSPPYSNRLTDFGVSLPVLKAVHANLNKWIEDTPDAATPAEPAAERPTTALFGDDDDDDNHNNNNAIIDTKNLLKTALKELGKQSTMARYPLPRLSLEAMICRPKPISHTALGGRLVPKFASKDGAFCRVFARREVDSNPNPYLSFIRMILSWFIATIIYCMLSNTSTISTINRHSSG
jgi:hypothetical protein